MKKSKRAQITKQMQHNPDNDTALLTNESPAIREARAQETRTAEAAQQACSAAEAAQRTVEEASRVLTEKETQVSKVRAEFEAVGERLAGMPLDDPDSERVGGRHRHLEIVLRRLESEHGGCHETLLTAQRRAEESLQAGEVASASLRNAQRCVRLQELQEHFPMLLDQVLALIEERNRTLAEADQDSNAHQLARLGRARLLPRQDQLRKHETYELGTILTRYQSGLGMVPSARFSDFSMDSGGGGEGVSEAGAVDPDEMPDLTEEEWLLLTTGAATDE